MEVLLAILGIAGAVVVLVTIINILAILTHSKVSLKQYKPKDHKTDRVIRRTDYVNQWAKGNGFEFLEYYWAVTGFHRLCMAAWQRTDRPTFLCTYLVPNQSGFVNVTDIVTEFANGISLTTANSKDAQFQPKPPKAYHQTFSRINLDEQWHRHIEMENFLMDVGCAELAYTEIQFEKHFVDAVCKENRYIRGIPYWYLLGTYWYFVRKNFWHNKSIKTQHEKGMIKLPNEMSEDYPTVKEILPED